MIHQNYNRALMHEDCTKIFVVYREEVINPYAKDFFQDMLEQLNINQNRR
jgi:hypothetical protein